MKGKILAVAIMFVVGLGFTSCKKCVVCQYEYAGSTIKSSEVCGKKSEIEDLEKQWETSASLVGATAECIEQ